MYKNICQITRLLLLFWILILSLYACDKYELDSLWKDREIVVDGNKSDWLEGLTYIEEFDLSVGFFNDDDFLYVCAEVENPLVRMRVMRQGLTVWFGAKGGRMKSAGVRFPLGLQIAGGVETSLEPTQMEENFQAGFRKTLEELEILGPGRQDRKRLLRSEAEGIEVALNASSGLLVYELKVPLAGVPGSVMAVGASAGESIVIGIETNPVDRRSLAGSRLSRPSGRGGTGMGGRPGYGARPGMGGMPGAGRGSAMFRELKLWFTLSLAQGDGR